MGHVYFVQAERFTDEVAMLRGGTPGVRVALGGPFSDGPIKVGFTEHISVRVGEIAERIRQRVALVGVIEGSIATERALHRRFGASRVWGDEYITMEWFAPSDDLVDFIRSLKNADVHVREYEFVRKQAARPPRARRRRAA